MNITAFSELTIDGRMTLRAGASSKALFAFYGEELQQWFHAQRAAHDAIMVGAGTVRNDNPELTVRHAAGANPLRIIPTNDGRIPSDSHILNDGIPTWLAIPCNLASEIRNRLCTSPAVHLVECGETAVDLTRLITALRASGIQSIMVEGGSRLLHGLFASGLISRIVIKHIPVISGSLDASTYLAADAGLPALALSRWQVVEWRMIGGIGVSIYEPLKDSLDDAR